MCIYADIQYIYSSEYTYNIYIYIHVERERGGERQTQSERERERVKDMFVILVKFPLVSCHDAGCQVKMDAVISLSLYLCLSLSLPPSLCICPLCQIG